MAAEGRVYLDHNATSPLRPEAMAAMVRALALPGNPSSIHGEGRAARAAIELGRDQVARLVGARAKNVAFTSGGTEASNLVLSPSFRRLGTPGSRDLLIGATEHPCGLNGHRFAPAQVTTVPVDGRGVIDVSWLEARLGAKDAQVLVSIQLANSETGALQPVSDIARIVHAAGGLLHVDAVQGAGRLPLDIGTMGADALTLSAHKIGGPKGAGAVILGSDQLEIADKLLRGGGQERGVRAGTENIAAIAGFGEAAERVAASLEAESARLSLLRDEAERHLRRIAPDVTIFSQGAQRLPNTLAFAIPGLKAEMALIAFDLQGIALSSGSACSSGKVRRSHVLDAMGIEPSLAEGALRVSLGWTTTNEDIVRFVEACERVVDTLYRRRVSAA